MSSGDHHQESGLPALTNERRTDGRDLELAFRLGRLYVAVVSDCLDQLGVRDNVMDHRIRPLHIGSKAAGFATTVHLVEVDGVPEDSGDWYRGELEAVEALQPGDVMVVSTCNGSYWGELLATASRYRGMCGVVADAYTRDTLRLMEMDFPTFVSGISAQDSLGRSDVAAWGEPISCGGVSVSTGDMVIADNDGVAVIPEAIAPEVISRAEEKAAAEGDVREKLAAGMPISEAFATYGIL